MIMLIKLCSPGYVAGFTDSEVNSRPDLYDVYVNLADSEITISPVVKGWLLLMFWIWGLFISESIVTTEPQAVLILVPLWFWKCNREDPVFLFYGGPGILEKFGIWKDMLPTNV